MTSEQNKAIVRRFWAAFETNDQAALEELLAPDVVGHLPGAPGPQNREAMLQGIIPIPSRYKGDLPGRPFASV